MVKVEPKSKITRFLNRIPFYGVWFNWFGGSPRQKFTSAILLSLCIIALLAWDWTVLVVRWAWDDLVIPIVIDYLHNFFK